MEYRVVAVNAGLIVAHLRSLIMMPTVYATLYKEANGHEVARKIV